MRRRAHAFGILPEERVLGPGQDSIVLWKERVAFFRDVKHWSQIVLIVGLVFVYLFSIRSMPLDIPYLRSLISFLNVGTAGFVIAALGLRFTFPSVSLEGRAWWVLKSSPLTVSRIMRQKFVFSAAPTVVVALVIGVMTNWILGADRFTAGLTLAALLVSALAITAMGIGFGALFPRFTVENIHQIESSVGGFVYMAACLWYIGATLAILALPMQMHVHHQLHERRVLAYAGALWAALNLVAVVVPWMLGRRALENHEE